MNVKYLWYIIPFLASFLSASYLLPIVQKKVQNDTRFFVKNYKQENIPTAYGLLFLWNYLLLTVPLGFLVAFYLLGQVPGSNRGVHFANRTSDFVMTLLIFLFPAFPAMFCFYDDLYGDKKVKGIKNNLKILFQTKKVPSSLTKGFFVLLLAVIFSTTLLYEHIFPLNGIPAYHRTVNVFLICFFTNFVNLLDLRPGRAIKVFALLFIILVMGCFHLSDGNTANELLFYVLWCSPVIGALFVYAPLDFKGQSMMGDTGSNMLGFMLGIGYAMLLPLWIKVIFLLSLVAFHIYCEFYSFSDLVERNRVLRWLDRLFITD